MQINLNDRTEEFPTEGIQYFGQLMERLSQRAEEDGGSVLSVKLNGEDITGRDRSHLAELPIEDINQLEIQTGDPKDLARSTLHSIAEFLEQLLSELQKTAELFRLGNDEQSNESFVRCLDGLQVFMHSLETCRKLLGVSFELLIVPSADGRGDRSVAESRRMLFSILDGMIDTQSNQDWVLLADMLEYELIPGLEGWRPIISAIFDKTDPEKSAEIAPELIEAQPVVIN